MDEVGGEKGRGYPVVIWFDSFIAWLTRLGRPQAALMTVLAVGLALSASYLVGPHLWFGPVYLLIICLPAWTLGWRVAVLVGFCCAGLSIAMHGAAAYPMGQVAVAWNLAMRVLAVAVIIVLVRGFRRSYDREWRRARSDDLTGALTRQAFLDEVAMLRRRQRGGGLLAYVDLDGFKRINDRHGHAAGDDVLRAFAQGVREHLGANSRFARAGGDEFLFYLPARDEADAYCMAERFQARLHAILMPIRHPLRCSTGVLLLEPGCEAVTERHIALADRLMYEAKRQGGAALRIASAAICAGENRRRGPRRPSPSRHAA